MLLAIVTLVILIFFHNTQPAVFSIIQRASPCNALQLQDNCNYCFELSKSVFYC